MVELKQANKQLETMEKEKLVAKQTAYEARMTKTTESLTAQFRDVARAFYTEVWGQALTTVGVSAKSKLQAPN